MTRRIFFAAAFLPAALCAQNDLQSVLRSMDASAQSFKSLTADVKRTQYVAIIKNTSEEFGTINILRVKKGDQRALIVFTKPNVTRNLVQNGKFIKYYPATNTLEEYDIGQYKTLVELSITLGFGTTSKDLEGSYTVKFVGSEVIDGQKAAHLLLTPKSAQAKKDVVSVELWMSEKNYPLRYRINLPNEDYNLVEYSNIKLNPPLQQADVDLKAPANAKKTVLSNK